MPHCRPNIEFVNYYNVRSITISINIISLELMAPPVGSGALDWGVEPATSCAAMDLTRHLRASLPAQGNGT